MTASETQSTTAPEEPSTNDSTDYSTLPTDSTTVQESTTDEVLTTITTLRIPTTTTLAPPIHRCPPSGFGYIPHHTNCNRYFECIRGVRHLRFCHENLLFDSVTLECTSPELAVCAGTL